MARKRAASTIEVAPIPPTTTPVAPRPAILPVHGQKLVALAANRKLPSADLPRLQVATVKYAEWIQAMDGLKLAGDKLLERLVVLLNGYKRTIDIDLIYDSPDDFLYRQSGQHKVGNSILEEFLPRLADTRLVPGLGLLHNYKVWPQGAFAAFTIIGSAHSPLGDSIFIRQKNQDYAISKQIYLKASTTPGFTEGTTFQTDVGRLLGGRVQDEFR
jgi:hypothetical protein